MHSLRSRPIRSAAALVALALVAAACGQRPGVGDGSSIAIGDGAGSVEEGDEPIADPGSDTGGDVFGLDDDADDDLALDDTDDASSASSPSTGGGSSSGSGDGGSGSGGGGSGSGGGGAPPPPPGDDGGGDEPPPGDDGGGDEPPPGDDGGGDEPPPGDDGGDEPPPGDDGGGDEPPPGDDGGDAPPPSDDGGGNGDDGDGDGDDGTEPVRGSDRTGVTDTAIRYGAHAPVTGAAPLPARSFETAADLYWRWVTDAQGQQVLGRDQIEVVFADDQYQPSRATQVCRTLAESNFLLFGAGGTDQIQACGRLGNQGGLPYFSAGVTTAGLEGLPWYFAFSMSYRDQGRMLAEYVAANFPDARVAAILTETANFNDAVQGWEAGVAEQGIDYVRTLRHPRGDTSWYNTFARELAQADVDLVYINTAPVDYLRFAQQAAQQGFDAQFVGVGITMGLNPLLESGCDSNELDGGIFFSPFPGLDWARQNVPDFFAASEQYGTTPDDLAFAIWGQARTLHDAFDRYEATFGTDLTREDFRALIERQTDLGGDIFPPVSYSPDDHFGGAQVHVLRADCASREHQTLETFVDGF